MQLLVEISKEQLKVAVSWTGESEEDMKDYRHTEFCKADRTR